MQNQRIRVAIVDDHPMVREGLKSYLQLSPLIEIVGIGCSREEAIAIAENSQVDVLLLDLVMETESSGLEALRCIKHTCPATRVIALTSFSDEERMAQVIAAGADGYLQKTVTPDDLLNTITLAHAGRVVFEGDALQAFQTSRIGLVENPQPRQGESTRNPSPEILTAREQQVLHALASGMSNKEIAVHLGMSEKTAKVHVSHILAKLEVYDRTQAILCALRLGLISLP